MLSSDCIDLLTRFLAHLPFTFSPETVLTQLNTLSLILDAVVFSRLMGAFALLFSSVSEPPVENLEQTALSASGRNHNSSQRIGSASDIEFNTLSSVMDRLYVWEKRLHKEIMVWYFSYKKCLDKFLLLSKHTNHKADNGLLYFYVIFFICQNCFLKMHCLS